MSIAVKRLEPGIYLGTYTEDVTFEQIYESNRAYEALAKEDRLTHFALIIEGGGMRRYPSDVRAIQKAIMPGISAIFMLHIPKFGELIARILNSVTQLTIEPVQSLDQAVVRARTIIMEKNRQA